MRRRTVLHMLSMQSDRAMAVFTAKYGGLGPNLRRALREAQNSAGPIAADAIRLVIAPYLSPEAQALCKENQIGFLDFEGNARITVGDFFIVMRALPRNGTTRVRRRLQNRLRASSSIRFLRKPCQTFLTGRPSQWDQSPSPPDAAAQPLPPLNWGAPSKLRLGGVARTQTRQPSTTTNSGCPRSRF